MKLIIIISLLVQFCHAGTISEHKIQHHEGATSYQNVHIEHFHPVPTYIKKEHAQLLEHPVSVGTSSSKVQINHGTEHDAGYALSDAENQLAYNHEVAAEEEHQPAEPAAQYEAQEYLGQGDVHYLNGHYDVNEGSEGEEYGDAGHVQYEAHEA